MAGEEGERVQSIKSLPPRLGQLGSLSAEDSVDPYSDPARSSPQPCMSQPSGNPRWLASKAIGRWLRTDSLRPREGRLFVQVSDQMSHLPRGLL